MSATTMDLMDSMDAMDIQAQVATNALMLDACGLEIDVGLG
jgi:hypothetical protein